MLWQTKRLAAKTLVKIGKTETVNTLNNNKKIRE